MSDPKNPFESHDLKSHLDEEKNPFESRDLKSHLGPEKSPFESHNPKSHSDPWSHDVKPHLDPEESPFESRDLKSRIDREVDPNTESNGAIEYTGAERRHHNRRTITDRRTEIRFEIGKEARRIGRGRRFDDGIDLSH